MKNTGQKRNTVANAYLVGVRLLRSSRTEMERSLEELVRLVETAGGEVLGQTHQEIKKIDPATLLGSGKLEEIRLACEELGADCLIVDSELSPVQQRNIEKIVKCSVLDRTGVILDIFAMRARSKEGRLQVELAQLEYLAPRLVGRGESFSQQSGHMGSRGPGETALEYDRRNIRRRIDQIKENLEKVRSHRSLHRDRRDAIPLPLVALVGYTNAGKSTLMNALTNAGVFVEDKPFATLDPTVRRLRLTSGREVLLADTVGFIRRLPHQLVEAFQSTFEEIAGASLIIHLFDGSDPEVTSNHRVVEKVLTELHLAEKERLDVLNKCDLPLAMGAETLAEVSISAATSLGLSNLLSVIDQKLGESLRHMKLSLPTERGDILSKLYTQGRVTLVEYRDQGIYVECEIGEKYLKKYAAYAFSG